jgi:hypothetical protein
MSLPALAATGATLGVAPGQASLTMSVFVVAGQRKNLDFIEVFQTLRDTVKRTGMVAADGFEPPTKGL